MVGTAPPFRDALAKAAKAARGHGHVLIEGESGTGKEMLVRAMHSASPRTKTAMRMVNVAAISASSLESVLFGHEKGAFAGAFEQQVGAIQTVTAARWCSTRWTACPPNCRTASANHPHRAGPSPSARAYTYKIDVRIIAASNLPLADWSRPGIFVPTCSTAVVEHLDRVAAVAPAHGDIPALTRHFLSRIGEQPGLRPIGITWDALQLFAAFDWPGNVRQFSPSCSAPQCFATATR